MARIARKYCVVLLLAAMFYSLPLSTTAYAKKKVDNSAAMATESAGKSYVVPYALVGLGITLGVLLVARPGTRADQAKRRKIDEEEDD